MHSSYVQDPLPVFAQRLTLWRVRNLHSRNRVPSGQWGQVVDVLKDLPPRPIGPRGGCWEMLQRGGAEEHVAVRVVARGGRWLSRRLGAACSAERLRGVDHPVAEKADSQEEQHSGDVLRLLFLVTRDLRLHCQKVIGVPAAHDSLLRSALRLVLPEREIHGR